MMAQIKIKRETTMAVYFERKAKKSSQQKNERRMNRIGMRQWKNLNIIGLQFSQLKDDGVDGAERQNEKSR